MNNTTIYPSSPNNVPESLTEAKASYKKQAFLAMLGLVIFMLIYIAIAACFGFITYKGITSINGGDNDFIYIVVTAF